MLFSSCLIALNVIGTFDFLASSLLLFNLIPTVTVGKQFTFFLPLTQVILCLIVFYNFYLY